MVFIYIKKTCIICGEQFDARHEEQQFCTHDCSIKYKLETFKTKYCKLCGIKLSHTKNYCTICKDIRTATKKMRFEILKRDKFTCQYCGRTPQDGAKLVIDHIIPHSKGGKTILTNLTVSCADCNGGKSDIMLNITY